LRQLVFALALVSGGSVLWADEPSAGSLQDSALSRAEPLVHRPRIGLVLGGGGAKGAAHVGVLQVLEELRIPVDCIAGTSMGALVGATYAAGATAAEIDAAIRSMDWAATIGGQGLRDRTPIERKLANSNFSNSLDVGIRDGRIRGRGGLVATQSVEGEIWKLVASAQLTSDFDELPIPFRAVATDMIAGDMVVLDSGDLATAMRASMAIPGAFAPVSVDGQVLADGGLMRNLPIDVARNLCADVVIAIWFRPPQVEQGDISSSLALAGRAMDVMIGANQRNQIETLTESDIGIEVDTLDISTRQFERATEAIEYGREAGFANRDRLSQYSVSAEEYRAWTRVVQDGTPASHVVADVRVTGTDRVNPDYVLSKLDHARPVNGLGIAEIVAETEKLYALGDFEHINYQLGGTPGARVLTIDVTEKSWGPNFIGFDYGLAMQGGGQIDALLRLEHDRTWMNNKGGRWHNVAQLGDLSLLRTDFYQPLDVQQRFFVQPVANLENWLEDLYLDGDRAARYAVRHLYGQLDLGVNFGTRAQLRLGLRHGWESARLDTGLPGLPELSREKDSNLQLQYLYDTRDSVGLPTRGSLFNTRYVHSEGWFGSNLDYSAIEAVWSRAFNLNGNSLSLIAGGGSKLSGELPITQQIRLGGIRTFPGLRPGELRGDEYWFIGSSYLWQLAVLQPLFGQALYAGVRLQAGEMLERFDSIDSGPLYGIAGSLTGSTPIGSFLLSLGYVDDGSLRLQFTLGRPVPEGSMLDDLN
jgi:NTE family protein